MKKPKTVPVAEIGGKTVFLVLHVCDAIGQPVYEGDELRQIDDADHRAFIGGFRRTAKDPTGVLTTIRTRYDSWTGSGNMQQSGWIRADTPMTLANRARIGYNRFRRWARFTNKLPAKGWRILALFPSKHWNGNNRQPIYDNHLSLLRRELRRDFRRFTDRLLRRAAA